MPPKQVNQSAVLVNDDEMHTPLKPSSSTMTPREAPRSPPFIVSDSHVANGSRDSDRYVYHRPSFASSSSSGSVRVIQQTPGRSTRSLARMSSGLSSVPDILIEAPVIILLLLLWSVR